MKKILLRQPKRMRERRSRATGACVSALALSTAAYAAPAESDVHVLAADTGDSQSPLRVLFQVPHVERIPMLLRHYAHLNWTMLMATGSASLSLCERLCVRSEHCTCAQLPDPCDTTVVNPDGTPKLSRHMHDLLIAPYADGSSDLLFVHADMWLSRRVDALLRSDDYRHKIVMPRARAEHMCYRPGTADFANVSWPLWEQFAPLCASAIATYSPKAEDDEPDVGWPLRAYGHCCYGWSDLLYLPRAVQPYWAALATGPLAEVEGHEAAISTISHALAFEGVAELTDLSCGGDCCNAANEPLLHAITQTTNCMHPVDLRDAAGWAAVEGW